MCKDGYNLVTCGKCDGEGTVIDGTDAAEFEATCSRCGGSGKIRMITDTKAFAEFLLREKDSPDLADRIGCATQEEALAHVAATLEPNRVYDEHTAHTCPKYRNDHWGGCFYSPAAQEANAKNWTVNLCIRCLRANMEAKEAARRVPNPMAVLYVKPVNGKDGQEFDARLKWNSGPVGNSFEVTLGTFQGQTAAEGMLQVFARAIKEGKPLCSSQ